MKWLLFPVLRLVHAVRATFDCLFATSMDEIKEGIKRIKRGIENLN